MQLHLGVKKSEGREETTNNCVCIYGFLQPQPFLEKVYPQLLDSDDGFVDRLLVSIPKTHVLMEEVALRTVTIITSFIIMFCCRRSMSGAQSCKHSPSHPCRSPSNSLLIGTVKTESTYILSVRKGRARCTECLQMKWPRR